MHLNELSKKKNDSYNKLVLNWFLNNLIIIWHILKNFMIMG